jgi:hypothetical protein
MTATVGIHGVSARFLNAVATDHDWVIKVEVHSPTGAFLADISGFITSGSVSVDETRAVRRTLALTIQGTVDLIPNNLSDLLHPATANELYVWRGVRYSSTPGDEEFAQLGIFRMTKPNITDDGATVTLTVSGQDRSSVISRIAWQAPYYVYASAFSGLTMGQVLRQAIASRYPGLDLSQVDPYNSINFSFPGITWGQNPSSGGGDPMSDFITFAGQAGAELFFDPLGRPVLRLIRNPLTTQVIDGTSFVEGVNGVVMTSAQRTLDESTAFNGLILYCNGNGDAQPFVVKVWDQNINSETFYRGAWGEVPYTMTTLLIPSGAESLAQAQVRAITMATNQLQLILGTFDDVSLTCVPNPALWEGDCMAVQRARMISFRPRIYVKATS